MNRYYYEFGGFGFHNGEVSEEDETKLKCLGDIDIISSEGSSKLENWSEILKNKENETIEKIAEALYCLNKEAKKIRDSRENMKEELFGEDVGYNQKDEMSSTRLRDAYAICIYGDAWLTQKQYDNYWDDINCYIPDFSDLSKSEIEKIKNKIKEGNYNKENKYESDEIGDCYINDGGELVIGDDQGEEWNQEDCIFNCEKLDESRDEIEKSKKEVSDKHEKLSDMKDEISDLYEIKDETIDWLKENKQITPIGYHSFPDSEYQGEYQDYDEEEEYEEDYE
jgi:hypothetical protein